MLPGDGRLGAWVGSSGDSKARVWERGASRSQRKLSDAEREGSHTRLPRARLGQSPLGSRGPFPVRGGSLVTRDDESTDVGYYLSGQRVP